MILKHKPAKNLEAFDVIILTAEYYDDHPLSPAGVIARVLEAKGFTVGIIERPQKKDDFTKLGSPKLFFAVTSGSIDSMLNNYTPLKKRRALDPHNRTALMPDRAVIFYCNQLRQFFKGSKIVIGGIEASLRRFAHYDYWDNKIRGSILLDSRADILVYGNGEKQIIEIAERLKSQIAGSGNDLVGIKGTCILQKTLPAKHDFAKLPPFFEVKSDDDASTRKFCEMQALFSNNKNLAQEYHNNYVVQYKYPEYTAEDIDWIYSLPFTRTLHPNSLLNMARFSVVTHRGCIGKCNFCALTLHQGDKIISRSEESILKEITSITSHPDFKGFIDDLGGPSANMYGMDSCKTCQTNHRSDCLNSCLQCAQLDKSHSRMIRLLKKAREIPKIKKIFIRSGVRYDLAMNSKEYIKEISEHHLSGCLKIAPEHFSKKVLSLMNKNHSQSGGSFEDFKKYFDSINQKKGQYLNYYFMVGHPGDDLAETRFLANRLAKLKNIEAFQLFTPTPMTNSTCMYWTGINPCNFEKVDVVHDYLTKKRMKQNLLRVIDQKTSY